MQSSRKVEDLTAVLERSTASEFLKNREAGWRAERFDAGAEAAEARLLPRGC